MYGTGPSGLPGNDDLGTMSAWYVFSALGLYPQTPGSANMLLGAPVFPRAVVLRPGGKSIVVSAPGADATHVYVEAVRVNGQPTRRSWTGADLTTGGGTVSFGLAEQPDTRWATGPDDLPR
ncbi:glycoside hydrolase domain-containing protein [Streptomyces sp. NPDC006446]|uniref:glycoside hydrolase domain-containing protein n=1 Tax=Streptomyces sp. NPDC006446 TaxID=3154301 RepID=UPI0033A81BBE